MPHIWVKYRTGASAGADGEDVERRKCFKARRDDKKYCLYTNVPEHQVDEICNDPDVEECIVLDDEATTAT